MGTFEVVFNAFLHYHMAIRLWGQGMEFGGCPATHSIDQVGSNSHSLTVFLSAGFKGIHHHHMNVF